MQLSFFGSMLKIIFQSLFFALIARFNRIMIAKLSASLAAKLPVITALC
jgi:hypothetical protein